MLQIVTISAEQGPYDPSTRYPQRRYGLYVGRRGQGDPLSRFSRAWVSVEVSSCCKPQESERALNPQNADAGVQRWDQVCP